ncbi:pyridoxamine 5'-phosphate oxidase family protein [uncultured Microbacterium sp.]|uniref:pyridoxamine 5'-phosphate oxidase family protein n=1 Tax=uncultured Microbacterium sp. TaxID=191216 RepID=UPI0035CBCDAB
MTGTIFDIALPAHEKALRMLERDLIAWITTIDAQGRPHAVPVWFMWHGERVVVFSEPGTQKVRHIRAGSPVLVHLQAGGTFGGDVVILNGHAEISERPASEWLAGFRDDFVEKYEAAIADYGMPLEKITETFSAAIVFTPEAIKAW